MEICPAYTHVSLQSCARHGFPPIRTLFPSGIKLIVCGMQGCGVRTPSAAAVAEATSGLVSVVHSPKGPTFTRDAASNIVAAGFPSASTTAFCVTLSGAGAVPKEHIRFAPIAVSVLIHFLLFTHIVVG